MVYWIVVLTLWLVSIFLLAFGGAQIFEYLLGRVGTNNLYIGAGSFALGLLFNFLVVNWPVERTVIKKQLDEKTLKALKYMAKVVPLAPQSVKKGLEEIVQKLS